MKFALNNRNSDEEEDTLRYKDNVEDDPDYNPMDDLKPSSAAPKRTITETGAIVLTGGIEGEMGEEEAFEELPTPKRKRGPAGSGTGRGKRFRSEWLSFEMFKGWLRAHPNPERAMCSACNIVLNAGKSELEKHATSIKHQRKMVDYRQQHGLRIEYEADNQSVVLVDSIPDNDDRMSSSFIQRAGVYKAANSP